MTPICTESCSYRQSEAGPLACHAPFLEVVLEHTDTHLAYLDAQLTFLLANNAYLQGCGYRREELLGRNFFELFPDPQKQALFEKVRDSGEEARFQTAPFSFAPVHPPCEAESFWNWTLTPVKSPSGQVTGLVHSLTDVTAQVQLQEQRLRTTEALREANQRKDEFLALLAHELRTPLAHLTSAAQILKRGPGKASSGEALQVITSQVWHMARLIEDLLDVSRISRGTIRLQKRPVPLDMVMESALLASRPLMAEREHQLTVSLPEAPLYLNADATRLTQVFSNLLQNAARYTPSGGRVWVSVAREGDKAVIRVKDSGIGLSAEALPLLFKMFSQIKTGVESKGGLGVGLALAERLTQMHGGTISVHSEGSGRGSEFIVQLPILLPSEAAG